jgi:hypothetical protein
MVGSDHLKNIITNELIIITQFYHLTIWNTSICILEIIVEHENIKRVLGTNTNSRGSAVGLATGYGLDDRGVGVRVPIGSRIFTFHIVRTGSGVHPTSYLVGTGAFFPGGKAAGAWS